MINHISGRRNATHKRVEGIVLAAGFSSRAGTNKLLLDWEGKSILERCLESMSQVCSRIIIVGGYRVKELEASLKPAPHLEVVFNQDFTEGMFSSVKKGIEQIREERFFLCPGDYPLIKKQTYIDLIAEEDDIIIPTYQGRSGHPVLISSCHIQTIRYGGFCCLRDFVKSSNPSFLEVSDQGILMDVDTMQDYERLIRSWSKPKDAGEGNNEQYMGGSC